MPKFSKNFKVEIEPEVTLPISKLTNDSNFLPSTGKATSVTTTASVTKTTGVSAGSYGQSTDVSTDKTGTSTITVPYFTVDPQGRVTTAINRTITITSRCSVTSGCSETSSCSNCSECSQTTACSQCSQCSVTSGCDNCTHCNYTACKCVHSNCTCMP